MTSPTVRLFEGSADDSWVWDSSQNLSAILSSYMQNLSVSLLSGQFSKEGNSTAPYDTLCWYSSTTYEYDEVWLFATYGAALLITAVCMFFGLRTICMNGAEESVSFSRILGAILNTSLFEDRFKLTNSSRPDGEWKRKRATHARACNVWTRLSLITDDGVTALRLQLAVRVFLYVHGFKFELTNVSSVTITSTISLYLLSLNRGFQCSFA